MKKFNFRFAVVLDARKAKENDALRLLGAAQRAHQDTIKNKQYYVNELARSLQRRESLGEGQSVISVYHAEQNYITGLKQKLIQADQSIMRASRGVEKALRAYLFARRQCRAIETLYEQDYKEHKKDLMKKEQKELDDLIVMRTRLKEELL